MHIEIDVLEITILIAAYFFFKWGFRFSILLVLMGLASRLKERGKEQLDEFKRNFDEDKGE